MPLKYKIEFFPEPDDGDSGFAGLEGTFCAHITESAVLCILLAIDEKNSIGSEFDAYGIARIANQSRGEIVLDDAIRTVANLATNADTRTFPILRMEIQLAEARLRYATALLALEKRHEP